MVLFSNIRVVLLVALAFANAVCFSRCEVHFEHAGAPPCHEHGKPNADRCVHQHDLNVAAWAVAHVAAVAAMPVEISYFIGITLGQPQEISDPSPPPLPRTRPVQPLRI